MLPDSSRLNGVAAPKLLPSEPATFQMVDVAAFKGKTASGEVETLGWLEIPGTTFSMPKQRFLCAFSDRRLTFESQPDSAWPKITVEVLADSPANGWRVKYFRVRPSADTTDGEILYSRVEYLLSSLGQCLLHIDGLDKPIKFSFQPFTEEETQQLLFRAKVFRKLKYLERIYSTSFDFPVEVNPKQVEVLDFIFRGVTEGEFMARGSDVTLPLLPAEADLAKPPFDGPGELHHRYADEFCDLFDRRLSIGPVLVHLNQAEIASPQAVRQLKMGGQAVPVWTRFSILDHQIHMSFERKAGQTRKQLRQRLELFKRELAKEEPAALVALLDEPLISDVSAEEAYLIAVGWTDYHNLPDRYCPQPAMLDAAAQVWRVPLWLGYPDGQGGEVGELAVAVSSGKIVSHTPLEEVRSRGKRLARELLHAV